MIGFVLQSRSSGDIEAGALMFGSLYSILIKYQLFCQVSNAGTDVCVCVCVYRRDHFNCFLIPAESTLNTYCLINKASLYKGLLLFVYTHNENKIKKTNRPFCHLSFLSVNKLSMSQKWTETYMLCYVSHCFFPLFICKLNQIYFKNLFLYMYMYCRFIYIT